MTTTMDATADRRRNERFMTTLSYYAPRCGTANGRTADGGQADIGGAPVWRGADGGWARGTA
jgi:hypothetical protein